MIDLKSCCGQTRGKEVQKITVSISRRWGIKWAEGRGPGGDTALHTGDRERKGLEETSAPTVRLPGGAETPNLSLQGDSQQRNLHQA